MLGGMDDEIALRPAVAADAGPLLVVQRSAYLSEAQAYGEPFLPPLVETLDEVVAAVVAGGVLVAALAERVVGSVRWRVADGVCHIGKLSVAGDLQGRRVGSRLLAAAEEAAADEAGGVDSYALFTGADSSYNIRLYERHGYASTHTQRISDRVSLVHMAKVRAAR
jgi:ribosomal protein S18 acetylase RimI-like enzyme